MSDRRADFVLAAATMLALLGCGRSHPECRAPDVGLPAPCAPRGPDEWADGPEGGAVLLPVSIDVWPDGHVALATFITGVPGDAAFTPRRYTFRVGLRDGTVTPIGVEVLDAAWFEARWAAAAATLDEHLVCAVMPDGSELRLLPSRPGPGAPTIADGVGFGRALRRLDRTGRVLGEYTLWAAHPTWRGRHCTDRMVWRLDAPESPRLQCAAWGATAKTGFLEPAQCPVVHCFGEDTASWRCSGAALDGLLYCEP